MNEKRREELAQNLVRQTMSVPRIWDGKISKTVGPFDPKLLSGWSRFAESNIANAVDALRDLSGIDIERASGDETSAEWGKAWTMIEPFHLKLDRLRNTPWFGAGVGCQGYQMDYGYWAPMAMLSLNEAFCLSVGVEPKFLSIDAVQRVADPNLALCSGKVTKFLLDRHEQLRRRFDAAATNELIISTADFSAWLYEFNMEVTTEFRRRFLKRFGPARLGASDETPGKIEQREVKSVIKLLTLMAVDKYGYDPKMNRNGAAAKLARIAELEGVQLSRDTISKYLRRGAQSLPD